MEELEIRGQLANHIIVDEAPELHEEIKLDETEQKIQMTVDNLTKKGAVKRNMQCPCGSGIKVKHCHKSLLEFRHKKVQSEIDLQNQVADVTRKSGLSRKEYLQKVREEKLEENQNEYQSQNKI